MWKKPIIKYHRRWKCFVCRSAGSLYNKKTLSPESFNTCSLSNIHQDSNGSAWCLWPWKQGENYSLFFLPISDYTTAIPCVLLGLKCLPLPSAEEDRARENRLWHVGSRRPREKMHLLQLMLLLSYWQRTSAVEAHRIDMGKGVLRRWAWKKAQSKRNCGDLLCQGAMVLLGFQTERDG